MTRCRAGDGDEGFEFASAFDDPSVAFAEQGVGPRRSRDGLSKSALEVGVSLAGSTRSALGSGLDGAGREFGPRHQVLGGGELSHVQADLVR